MYEYSTLSYLFAGVNSLALQGDDRIVVSGDGIDAAHLTYCLRKKVGHADIISIKLMQQ
ncbi:hypothetical protein OIU84_011881 [Salix udensis]|uniref:Uncharacterized protein n=1 Tax=Salix udensis TaxID=889485 RepID=A0AAD6JNV4_9ROSI|nr:hypothetical protein OIU84_011881 [Salix udensis]